MGVDLDLVVYADLLDPEMFCPICSDALSSEDALETPCGHVFCSGCLIPFVRIYTQCPRDRRPTRSADLKRVKDHNPFVYRLLGSMTVRCKRHKEGCTWQGEFSETSSHLANGCPEKRQSSSSCGVANDNPAVILNTPSPSPSTSTSSSLSTSSSSSSPSSPSSSSVASAELQLLDKAAGDSGGVSGGRARFMTPPRLSNNNLENVLSSLDKVLAPCTQSGERHFSTAETAVPHSHSPSLSPNCSSSGTCFDCFRREIDLRKAKAESKKKDLHIQSLRSALSLLVSLVEGNCKDPAMEDSRSRDWEQMTSTKTDIIKTVKHILLP